MLSVQKYGYYCVIKLVNYIVLFYIRHELSRFWILFMMHYTEVRRGH